MRIGVKVAQRRKQYYPRRKGNNTTAHDENVEAEHPVNKIIGYGTWHELAETDPGAGQIISVDSVVRRGASRLKTSNDPEIDLD